MIFNSYAFLAFFPIVTLAYYLMPMRARRPWLLAASYYFYMCWNAQYALLIAASTLVTYLCALALGRMEAKAGRRAVLALGLAINLGILCFFKYFGFFTDTFARIAARLGVRMAIPAFDVLLPVGISFYTFQALGYMIDVYRGKLPPERSLMRYALFVSFFPQLVAGPIERSENLLRQVNEDHPLDEKAVRDGLLVMLLGFFEKLVIADRVGVIISSIWAESTAGLWPWIAVFLYPLQIYTDFSGCMDIVLGAAELFDIHLAENFKNPFFSRTCQEFWQRWHITLGGWARDYVFYPFMKSRWLVSFSRKTKKKFGKRWGKFLPWCVANAVLWFVMGFWHGSVQHIFGVSLWFWTVLFFSELFQPLCQKITTKFEFKTESFGWHLFQSLRTYIIYALGVVFFSASGLKEALIHYTVLLTSLRRLDPWTLFDGTVLSYGATWRDINVLILSVLCLTIADALREKYTTARLWVKEQSFGLRWCIWLFLFVMVLIFGLYGPTYDASSFIYQGF